MKRLDGYVEVSYVDPQKEVAAIKMLGVVKTLTDVVVKMVEI